MQERLQNILQSKFAQLSLMLGIFGVLGFIVTQRAQAFTLEPTGMAKPVADLRDYNGTYDGAIGTGSIGYSTLYRDNEDNGAISGCRGEGCGRHPGVDIPVPVGTKVYSTTWGLVVISRCDPSWGGLIVLQSQHPVTGETIYITFAHLSARTYSNGAPVEVGGYVSTGVNIGRSGGARGAPCSGNSTGAHLHYQVDRNHGSTGEPYFPSQTALNQRDDNYQVATYTLNPIVFVKGGYRWTFNKTGTTPLSRELWDLFNFQSWNVGNGSLMVDAGNDPYIRRGGLTNCGLNKPCSSNIAAEAYLYNQVFLSLNNQCSNGGGKIYFTTNTSPGWSEDKTVLYYSTFGLQNTHVWMPQNSKWNGIITGLRIDPAQACSPYDFDPTYYGEITIEK